MIELAAKGLTKKKKTTTTTNNNNRISCTSTRKDTSVRAEQA
jgi:hypothetical protein